MDYKCFLPKMLCNFTKFLFSNIFLFFFTNIAGGEDSTSGKPKRLPHVPEEAMPDLIRLVHANINNKNFLVKEFLSFWSKKEENLPIPKSKVLQKIQEIAEYQKSETLARKCWMVKSEFLKKYEVTEPEIPNKWDYVLECPNKSIATPTTPVAPRGTSTPTAGEAEKSASTETPKSEKRAGIKFKSHIKTLNCINF